MEVFTIGVCIRSPRKTDKSIPGVRILTKYILNNIKLSNHLIVTTKTRHFVNKNRNYDSNRVIFKQNDISQYLSLTSIQNQLRKFRKYKERRLNKSTMLFPVSNIIYLFLIIELAYVCTFEKNEFLLICKICKHFHTALFYFEK